MVVSYSLPDNGLEGDVRHVDGYVAGSFKFWHHAVTPPAGWMPPLRIACFHSFRMSGSNLRKQMCEFSNFAVSLGEQCEFRFLDGLHHCPPEKEAQMPERLRPLLTRTPCHSRAIRAECAC